MLTATKQWFTLPVLISCYCFVCTQANSGSVYSFKIRDGILSGPIALLSEGSKSSTHYLGDKNRFDVSSKGPSSGISVGGGGGAGKARVFLNK